jgi:hypothetical protein
MGLGYRSGSVGTNEVMRANVPGHQGRRFPKSRLRTLCYRGEAQQLPDSRMRDGVADEYGSACFAL